MTCQQKVDDKFETLILIWTSYSIFFSSRISIKINSLKNHCETFYHLIIIIDICPLQQPCVLISASRYETVGLYKFVLHRGLNEAIWACGKCFDLSVLTIKAHKQTFHFMEQLKSLVYNIHRTFAILCIQQ